MDMVDMDMVDVDMVDVDMVDMDMVDVDMVDEDLSHRTSFSRRFHCTTGVGDPRHQHQRSCAPPHPHPCSSLYNASRRTVQWLHNWTNFTLVKRTSHCSIVELNQLHMHSVSLTNWTPLSNPTRINCHCRCPQWDSSIINVNHVISSIQHSSIHFDLLWSTFDLLWSKFNAFSVTELNSTQHSSVMQLMPLNTAQLNSVRQLVSLSYHVFNPSRTNWHCHYLRLCNCNLLPLSTSQQKQKQNPPTKEKYHEPQEWMSIPTFLFE